MVGPCLGGGGDSGTELVYIYPLANGHTKQDQ